MAHYVWPSGRTATFKLWDSQGHKLGQVEAKIRDLEPVTFGKRSLNGGFNEGSYPTYDVVTAAGVTEVTEYRWLKPVFYITDNPEVKSALRVVK